MDASPYVHPSEVKKEILQWERGEVLGRGSYGVITSGFLKDGPSRSTPVAIKSSRGADSISCCRREKEFLDQLSGCPQIIRCYGDKLTIFRGVYTYNIVLELAPDGTLSDFLEREGRPMDERSARRYVRSMLRGLVHIHRNGVVHCDLKPDNVMLWGADEVKIIDFGFAMRVGEKNVVSSSREAHPYLAPECVAEKEYGAPMDVWALGFTVYELLTWEIVMDQPPGMKDEEYLALLAKGLLLPEMPVAMSESAKDFLSRCFVVDQKKRWTAKMLLEHPFVAAADVDD